MSRGAPPLGCTKCLALSTVTVKTVLSLMREGNTEIKLEFENCYYSVTKSDFSTKASFKGSAAKAIFDLCASRIGTTLHDDEWGR